MAEHVVRGEAYNPHDWAIQPMGWSMLAAGSVTREQVSCYSTWWLNIGIAIPAKSGWHLHVHSIHIIIPALTIKFIWTWNWTTKLGYQILAYLRQNTTINQAAAHYVWTQVYISLWYITRHINIQCQSILYLVLYGGASFLHMGWSQKASTELSINCIKLNKTLPMTLDFSSNWSVKQS